MAQYIVYACPRGPLATQLDTYAAASLRACGPNTAHRYMPHCTLTGFFEDVAEALPAYCDALTAAYTALLPERPPTVVRVLGMELRPDFHVLPLEAPWLLALAAEFARHAISPTRQAPIRLKHWLHLSLAYEFAPEHEPQLAALAREYVDPAAPAQWELCFYERSEGWQWHLHATWRV